MAFRLTRGHRLLHRSQFETVYATGQVLHGEGIRIHARVNEAGVHRLGLSVPRRAGNAVARNRYKRLLREAFRTLPPGDTPGVDLVVTVRHHRPLHPTEYQRLLRQAMDRTAGPRS